MPEPQTTPQQGDTFNAAETSPLEQAGSSEAEQLASHVATLRHQIEEANYQYYVQDNPTLSDAEYDQLMIELQRIEKNIQSCKLLTRQPNVSELALSRR